MSEKTLLEEHKEELEELLLAEEKDKEATLTEDEKLEEELRKEGLEEEEEDLGEEETEDEKLEKEILEEETLEELLDRDALIEERIKSSRLNNFLMNQAHDVALSDRGMQPIMNLEEDLEEIPLENKIEEQDFSYKRLEDDNKDPYRKVVESYESGKRSPDAAPELQMTPEQKLEQQKKMYGQERGAMEDPDKKFLTFNEPKEMGYANISEKARKGVY